MADPSKTRDALIKLFQQSEFSPVPGVSLDGGGGFSNGVVGGGGRLGVGVPLTDNLTLGGFIDGGGAFGKTPEGFNVRAAERGDGFIGLGFNRKF